MRIFTLILGFMLAVLSLNAQFDAAYSFVLQKATLADISGVTAEKGTLVYITDNDKIYQFDGTNWVVAADADGDASNELQALSYDPVTHVVTLSDGGTIDLSGLAPDTDWTISGNDQYSAVSGNVGIGNPTPSVKLDVTGTMHASETINVGANASGSRLSISDNAFSGSMLDVQTDDQGPWAFRILNNSYSADLAKAFRMYQSNSGQLSMSVGSLPHNFFTMNETTGGGNGGFGFGNNPTNGAFVFVDRGTKDLGDMTYVNLSNRITRTGSISNTYATVGMENLVKGMTTGGTMDYYGQRNYARIEKGAYNFRSVTGSYSYVYNFSTIANSNSSIYANYSVAYGRSDGGTKSIFGEYTRASKTQGTGNVGTIYGHNIVASKSVDGIGEVDNIYGTNIAVYGANKNQFGQSISVSAYKSSPDGIYGTTMRLYGRTGYTPKVIYGLNINSKKYESEPSNAIYNINVTSTGHASLPNNYGARFYMRDGVKNYGLYVDVKNGSSNNFAIYANNGVSFFRDKVGIGTNIPDQKLDVDGAAVIGSNNVNNVLAGQGAFQANSNLNNAGFVATPWVYARAIEGDQRGNAPTLITLGGQNGITNDDEIGFVTNGNQRMIIKPDGKVGVNTTIPKSELDVDGVLIEGKKVSMFGNYSAHGSCAVSHGIASFFTSSQDNNYIHIKLPYKVDADAKMYRIHVTGYRYRSGKVIDLTWVGYCYSATSSLLETATVNAGSPEFTMTQYVGSDKHIYLRFRGTTGSNYYQSFRVDSMHVGNGTILKEGDVQIISSASANL